MQRRLSKKEKETLLTMARTGDYSSTQLGKTFCISRPAVEGLLRRRGIKINRDTRTQFKKGGKVPPHAPLFGNKNPEWKGDKVGYAALHDWIERKLGKPRYCAYCQNSNKKGIKQYQWANISHYYRRDLSDWIRLCASCHKLFDLGKIKLK